MKKLLFVFIGLFFVSMAMAQVLDIKGRVEFESILVDVIQIRELSNSESACTLKFENGMVIQASLTYGPLSKAIMFFIGKKYRAEYYANWHVDLIEETGIEPIDKAVRIRMEEMQKKKEKREEKQRKKKKKK